MISAYALVFGGFLLLGGRAADMLGRRRIFLGGIVVFTVASLMAGLAWSEPSLITARAFQGLGAAIITPAALSILSTTFAEGRERNIALGAWGAVGGFGAVAGVLLGGVLTDALSWEWIFFVNVPVGVVGFALAPLLLHESRDAHVKRFDLPGAVLVTSGLSSLVYAITQAGQNGWLAAETLGVFGAPWCCSPRFVAWELRHPEPLMRFGILQTRTVSGANVAGFIMGTALFSMFLMLTLYMQQVLGYSADEDRRRLPRGRRYGDRLVGGRRPARDPHRGEAGAGDRDDRADRGPAVLHPGLRRRQLRQRPAARLPHHRGRDRVLLRPDLDRGTGRGEARRSRARIGADQHLAADRWRARHRRTLHDRHLAAPRTPSRGGSALPVAWSTASRRRSWSARSSPRSAWSRR